MTATSSSPKQMEWLDETVGVYIVIAETWKDYAEWSSWVSELYVCLCRKCRLQQQAVTIDVCGQEAQGRGVTVVTVSEVCAYVKACQTV